MSFNLSSDDEDPEKLEELWTKAAILRQNANPDSDASDEEDGAFSFTLHSSTYPSVASIPTGFQFGDGDDEESDEENSINWEDDAGNNDDDAEADTKLPARRLQEVTINLGSSSKKVTEEKKENKNKRRRSYRYSSLPKDFQSLLDALHKTHLLALTSHVVYVSSQCSNILAQSVAHSLLPISWTEGENGNQSEMEGYTSKEKLRSFCAWYFDLVHGARRRQQETFQANRAAGAPQLQAGQRKRGTNRKKRKRQQSHDDSPTENRVCSAYRLLNFCKYLSSTLSEDPQTLQQEELYSGEIWSTSDRVCLFIALARSMGWRCRYSAAVDPIARDLVEDHPLLKNAFANVFQAVASWHQTERNGKKRQQPPEYKRSYVDLHSNDMQQEIQAAPYGWVEVLCSSTTQRNRAKNAPIKGQLKWIHVDIGQLKKFDQPHRVEALLYEQQQGGTSPTAKRSGSRGVSKKRQPVAYVIAAEHSGDGRPKRITDVTPRYATSMVETLKLRGIPPKHQGKALAALKSSWWSKAVMNMNDSFKQPGSKRLRSDSKAPAAQSSGTRAKDAIGILSDKDDSEDQSDDEDEDGADSFEKEELARSTKSETLPTSKEKFKSHPLFVIPSVLKKAEVLAPGAKKRVCGFFKGEMVYARSDVGEALAEKKWLYQGRKVLKRELGKPVKRVKARAKSSTGGNSFKALRSYGFGVENDGSAESQKKQLELASAPLNDGMQALYGMWQTEPWSPPYVGPNDKIPVNEFRNVEKSLINPGLVHINGPKIAAVAKQLGM